MKDIRVYTGNLEAKEKIKKELDRREQVKAKRARNPKYKGAILSIGALSVLAGIGATSIWASSKNSKNIEPEITVSPTYAVTDENLEIVDTVGENNVNEVLEPGDVVEFEQAYVGQFEQSDEYGGIWNVSSKDDNSNDGNWCFAMHRENGNYGYVQTNSLEEFKPYTSTADGIFYRSKLNGECDGKINCTVGSTVYIDDSKTYKSKEGYQYCKVLVQNEVDGPNRNNYEYLVAYMGMSDVEKSNKEFSLGLVTKKTAMRTSPELKGEVFDYKRDESEKGVKYIIDISSYSESTFSDYMDTLKTLQSKGLLGGVIMEIARSRTEDEFKVWSMTGNSELDERNSAVTNNIQADSMGDYEQFKNYVEETMKICPVGFYVYLDTIEQDKAESLADIVYETNAQLTKDIPEYENATKFPLMIDIETGEQQDRQARTDTAINFINKLGDLNVIEDQYMFYTMPAGVVAKKEDVSKGNQITCIEDVQEGTPDYTLINVGASYVKGMLNAASNTEEYKKNLDPENLLNSMYSNAYYTEPFYMSHKNIAEADIMQCMGNINKDSVNNMKINRQVIDISVCPSDTYYAILSGNFKGHEGTFLSNMSNSIQKYKNKTQGNNINENVRQDEYERN